MATIKQRFDNENDTRPIKLFFEDEGRFGRINNLAKCWVPPKSRAIIGRQIIREYVYAYTVICPETGENYSLIMPNSNTESMSILLQEVGKEFENYRIIMAMDKAGWHTSKELRMPENIIIWNIPPYSPELNPTEHIWDYIREQKKFNNSTFNTLEEVEDALEKALFEISNEKKIIRSLTNFNWLY